MDEKAVFKIGDRVYTIGSITGTFPARQVQFGLKFMF